MFSFRKKNEPITAVSAKATILDLKKFKPLRDMGKKQLVLLEAKNQLRKYKEGERVLERGSTNNVEYFLLSGSIRKVAKDGKEKIIKANTPDAVNPVSHLQPRQFDVYANPECTMIEIAWDVIAKFFSQSQTQTQAESQPSYVDLGSPTLLKDLIQKFASDVKTGKFVLPSMPEIAQKVAKMVEDPTSSSGEVARTVALDPSIAVKLVSTANSPLFKGSRDINSCEEAVTRIGFKTTKQLVQLFALRELFSANNKEIRKRFRAHWGISRRVSAIAYIFAKCVKGMDENEALLGGIVQNIGVLPALVYLDSIPGLLESDLIDIDEFINKTKNVMGAYMLKEWKWPRELIEIAAHAEDWNYQPDAEKITMTDILILSEAHLNIIQKFLVNCPPLPNISSFSKLAHKLQLTPDKSIEIISAARNEISAVESSLLMPN
ncbi:HDOD domain-containing protein [Litoribrevibacter euphylliae]|uniref:HDOD domain-containing protein n=1 Tax=Litoribrevibacter euphylliae TaxID=1834034 RepID=A0ABV7HD68_9GAMM